MEDLHSSPPWQDSAREGMGQTRVYSEKIDLASVTLHGELSDTGYCLANVGNEYLVLQPGNKGEFTVNLKGSDRAYSVEWLNVCNGAAMPGEAVKGGGAKTLSTPFGGPAVLYLKLAGGGRLGTPSWAWKCFVHGHNYAADGRVGTDSGQAVPRGELGHPAGLPHPRFESPRRLDMGTVRKAIGNTRTLAKRVNLAAMTPHDELATTRYRLANPGVDYIAYLPEGDEVTVDPSAALGIFTVEWMRPVEAR